MIKQQKQKLVFLATALTMLMQGCQTGYHPVGFTGGYVDLPTSAPGFYAATFGGNGYTTGDRAYDLAKLRCAEKAFRDGYNYFVVFNSDSETVYNGSVSFSNAVAMPGGGAMAFGSSTPIHVPKSSVSILAFRRKPASDTCKKDTRIYDVKSFINTMSGVYNAKIDFSIRDENASITNWESWIYRNKPSKTSLNITKPVEQKDVLVVNLLDGSADTADSSYQNAVLQQNITLTEFPYASTDASISFLSNLAQELNSDVVLIDSTEVPSEEEDKYFLKRYTTMQFGVRYYGFLGIVLEPGLTQNKIYQIRNIRDPNSKFKLGDKILEINGMDTLAVKSDISELYYQKKPGDNISVKVSRNGELVELDVTLIK